MLSFEYPEDRDYFVSLLAKGNEQLFELRYAHFFDFRDPLIKRKEFNTRRNRLFERLMQQYGLSCRLKLHPDCSKVKKYDIDHVVPLATNELNKRIRHIKRTDKKKVPAQSFGSNHIDNLVIACKRCNAFKKHRIIIPPSVLIK